MGDYFHQLSWGQSFRVGEWIIHLHVALLVSNCQATPSWEIYETKGCISCLFLKCGFFRLFSESQHCSSFIYLLSVYFAMNEQCCQCYNIYTWLNLRPRICPLLLLLWNQHQEQGSLFMTRHHLPLWAWVMSERPREHRRAFVALAVSTSWKTCLICAKYFSPRRRTCSISWMILIHTVQFGLHKWWRVFCQLTVTRLHPLCWIGFPSSFRDLNLFFFFTSHNGRTHSETKKKINGDN